MLADLVPGEVCFLFGESLRSYCFFIVSKMEEGMPALLIKVQIPVLSYPYPLPYFLKVIFTNSISLGVRISTSVFWEDDKNIQFKTYSFNVFVRTKNKLSKSLNS